MLIKIHKIHWKKEFNSTGRDIDIEVTDTNAWVTKVNHPCANWAVGEAWCRVSTWFQKKGANVILDESGINNK